MDEQMQPERYQSQIEHLEQEPHRFGVLAATFRRPGRGLVTVNLPDVIDGRPLRVGDPIEVLEKHHTTAAIVVGGRRFEMPLRQGRS